MAVEDFVARHPFPVLVAWRILGGELHRKPPAGAPVGATAGYPMRTGARRPAMTHAQPGTRVSSANRSRMDRIKSGTEAAPIKASTLALLSPDDPATTTMDADMLGDRMLTIPRYVELRREDSAARSRKVTVGRTSKADVVVADFTVTAIHAELAYDPKRGAITITDLDSSNGTKVRGEVLVPHYPVPLGDGDSLSLGRVDMHYMTPKRFWAFLRELASPGV